jgi:hypothetical protein
MNEVFLSVLRERSLDQRFFVCTHVLVATPIFYITPIPGAKDH